MFLTEIQEIVYRHVFKPLAFKIDAEKVHDSITFLGNWMGKRKITCFLARALWYYGHPSLEQTIFGIHFANPVGLAAGFDKEGVLTEIMSDVGFGFIEVGSITGKPCEGNPKPRLWRLPKSQAILVNYGLKNKGCFAVRDQIAGIKRRIPIGISIAKTNCPETVDINAGIQDYCQAAVALVSVADYITINISCPNAYGGEPFTSPESLEFLLLALDPIVQSKPVFIKMSADLSMQEADKLCEVAGRHHVSGFIVSNLTKRRDRQEFDKSEVFPSEKGGVGGKPTFVASNDLIEHIYYSTNGKFVIIGVGGIFSAQDAYEKILRGASLVQLASGMIYNGPQVIGQINKGLVELLKKDGYNNISEAVGKYHKI